MNWTLITIGLFFTLLIFIASAKLAGTAAAIGETDIFALRGFGHGTMAKALRLTGPYSGDNAATAGGLMEVSQHPAPDAPLRPVVGPRHRQHETRRAPAGILLGNDATQMMVARAPPGGLVREWQA